MKQSKNDDSLGKSQPPPEPLATSQKLTTPPKQQPRQQQAKLIPTVPSPPQPQEQHSIIQQNSYIHDEPTTTAPYDELVQQEAEIHKQNLAALREQIQHGTMYLLNTRFAYEQARLDWELLQVRSQEKDDLIRIFAMQKQAYSEELQALESRSKHYQDETDAVIHQMQQAWSNNDTDENNANYYPSTFTDETEEQVADELQNMYNILSTTVQETKNNRDALPDHAAQHSDMPKLNISNIAPDTDEEQRLQKMPTAERVKFLKEKEMARLHALEQESEEEQDAYVPTSPKDEHDDEEEVEVPQQATEQEEEMYDQQDVEPEHLYEDEEHDIDQLEPEDILGDNNAPPQQFEDELFFASDMANSPATQVPARQQQKPTQHSPSLMSPNPESSNDAPSQSLYAKIQGRLNSSMKKLDATNPKPAKSHSNPTSIARATSDHVQSTPSIDAIIPARDVIIPQSRPKKRKVVEEPKEPKRQKRHNIDPQTAQKLALERAKAAQKRLKEEKEKRELEHLEKSKKLEQLEEKRQWIAQAAVAKKAMEEMLNSQIMSPVKPENTSVENEERDAEARYRLEEDRKRAAQRASEARRKLDKLKVEDEEKKAQREKEKWEERDRKLEAFRQRRIMEDHLKEEIVKRKLEERHKKELYNNKKPEKTHVPAPIPPVQIVLEEDTMANKAPIEEPTPRPKTAPTRSALPRHKTPPPQQQPNKMPKKNRHQTPPAKAKPEHHEEQAESIPVAQPPKKKKLATTKPKPASAPLILNPSLPAPDLPPLPPMESNNYAGYRMFTTVQSDLSPPNFSRTKPSAPSINHEMPHGIEDLHDISISPPPSDIPMFKDELSDKPTNDTRQFAATQKMNRFGWKAK